MWFTQRWSRLVLAAVGLTALTGETCGGGEGCKDEPAGYFSAFFTGGSPYPRSVQGEIVSIDRGTPGPTRIGIRSPGGSTDTLVVDAAGRDVPVVVGMNATFEVEYVPGFPSLSGLMIRDTGGLFFAGASDRRPAPAIFAGELPGIAMSLVGADCGERSDRPCYDAIENQALRFTRDGETVTLKNGETARLGDSQITCLAAQRIDYSDGCADAGLPSLSFVLARVGAPPEATRR